MKRDAELLLSEWRNRPGRKPLLIRGARQVGKTYLVEHWGAGQFDWVLTVDLERERDLHSLFSQTDPGRVLQELSLLRGRSAAPGTTLLFLDEIQACPAALALLRYFHELLPQLHVIAAGSLLDFALREFQYTMPVGRIEFLHLHPLSFEEFVAATEGEALAGYLKTWRLATPPSEALARRLAEALRNYFFVGGMPEAVAAYAARKDFLEVQRIQTALVETMQADFAKYGPRRLHDLMRKTYRHVAQNVGRKIKFVNISREDRSAEVRRALELLTLSRLVHPVVHTSANGLPLGAEQDERHFKALFLDIGLVNRLCGLPLASVEDLVTVHEGALAEQFVGQQLLSAAPAFEDARLFYWAREARNANAEVDFVIGWQQDILPVEVKAGKTGTLRSLFQFLREKGRRRAVRFHAGAPVLENVKLPGQAGTTVQLLSLPLYAAGQLDRLLQEAFGNQSADTSTSPNNQNTT
ncbi:MAG: ATP-binding protein [Verrucomicrobiia bacterium]